MSGSLVACAPTDSGKKINPLETQASFNEKRDLEKSFNDVEETHNDLQALLENFMKDVVAAKDALKERELVNSLEVNQKLTELETNVREYREQIFLTRNEENLEKIFNDINQDIQSIRQITERLKDGLGKDAIGEIQIYLAIFKTGREDNFGLLGPTTEKKINESLTQKSEQLKTKIIALAQTSAGREPPVTAGTVDDLTERIANLEAINKKLVARINNNEAEINNLKNLNNELQNIYNEFNQLKTSQPILTILFVIIVLVLAGMLLKSLFKKLQPPRMNKLTQEGKNTVNSTGNLDTQQLIVEVDKDVDEIFKKVDELYRLYEWLKSQWNTQTNQQLNTPYNNANNKSFIVKVVNDRIGEIHQDLQQEIGQRWEIELMNLKNQINQLQQNQQLKTSDNNANNKKLIFEAVKEEIHGQLQQEIHKRLDIELRNLPNQINQPQQNQQLKTPDNIAGGLPNLEFMLIYKEDPRSLSENAIEVSEADRSMDQPRISSTQAVIIQKVRRGNYWILNEADIDYMVPRHNIKINEYNSKTVANLFECQGYQSEYSGFQLIKPAKVSAISKGETWQLVERGILQFD
jgi:hypothetical protein